MSSQEEDLKSTYGLSPQEYEKIRTVEAAQSALHEWLIKKKCISTAEMKSLDCKSYDDFAAYWTDLSKKAKLNYDVQHEHGWRKWAKKYQSFAAGADRFMKDFSPMVELARGAGGPYSGLAIGTISVFFTIARNKSITDDIISSAIAGVKDRLPGFQIYEEIYHKHNEPENRIRKTILLAYSGFIELTIEATKYYLKSGIDRWWKSAWKPEKFEEMASNVQELIVAVRLQCEELLSWNVNEVRRQNKKLKADIERLQADSNNRHLVTLQDLFSLSNWSLDRRRQELRDYSLSIDRERRDDDILETMRLGSISRYKETAHFKQWASTRESMMLLLIGANHEDVNQLRNHCWLSPLALDLMQHFDAGSGIHAFYAFDIWKRTNMHTAMCEILFQLLCWKRHALDAAAGGDFLVSLSAAVKQYREHNAMDDEDGKKEALARVAEITMQLFEPHETVYIILDRIDRIDRCADCDRIDFLNMLIEMMEEVGCAVKILAVANRTGWDVEEASLRRRRSSKLKIVVEEQKILFNR